MESDERVGARLITMMIKSLLFMSETSLGQLSFYFKWTLFSSFVQFLEKFEKFYRELLYAPSRGEMFPDNRHWINNSDKRHYIITSFIGKQSTCCNIDQWSLRRFKKIWGPWFLCLVENVPWDTSHGGQVCCYECGAGETNSEYFAVVKPNLDKNSGSRAFRIKYPSMV